MGGRGGSSMSSGSVSRNAKLHEKFVAGELGTKVTKNDKFTMENAFPNMNYSRTGLCWINSQNDTAPKHRGT